jgi:hypothetical protein
MITWGGFVFNAQANSGGRYNPLTDKLDADVDGNERAVAPRVSHCGLDGERR